MHTFFSLVPRPSQFLMLHTKTGGPVHEVVRNITRASLLMNVSNHYHKCQRPVLYPGSWHRKRSLTLQFSGSSKRWTASRRKIRSPRLSVTVYLYGLRLELQGFTVHDGKQIILCHNMKCVSRYILCWPLSIDGTNQTQSSSSCGTLLYAMVKYFWHYRSNCTYNTKSNCSICTLNSIFESASCYVMNHLRSVCRTSGCNGGGLQCQAQLRLEHALRRFYKFTGFRLGQLEVMLPVLHCKDVFVRMATGSGKSLCMFLPPLAVTVLWL